MGEDVRDATNDRLEGVPASRSRHQLMTTWRRQRARPAPRGNFGLWAYEPLAFNGLTEVPENPSHWLYCGSTLPGMKIAFSETP